MKILILAPHPFYQNRGTPIAVKMLVETLVASGHQITVLTYPEGDDPKISSCSLVRLKQLSWVKEVAPGFSWKKLVYDWYLFSAIGKMLKTECFDVIHAVEESAFLAAWFGKKYSIPFVYDMDSSLSHQIGEKLVLLRPFLPVFRLLEKKVVQRAAGVLPVCRAIEDIVKVYDGNVLCQRLEDVSLLKSVGRESLPERTRLGLDSGMLHLMYVGNLEKYQGIDLLLDAFVLAAGKEKRARLVIIGGSDADIEFYKEKSAAFGLGEKVLFAGRRPVADLNYYLLQADILVSPRSKGFNTPMKIYSYLDSKRVILATRMQTHTQVLDGEIAYLVKATAVAMAAGMVELMIREDLRKSLAARAWERAQKDYTVTAYERKLNRFYGLLEQQIGVDRAQRKPEII